MVKGVKCKDLRFILFGTFVFLVQHMMDVHTVLTFLNILVVLTSSHHPVRVWNLFLLLGVVIYQKSKTFDSFQKSLLNAQLFLIHVSRSTWGFLPLPSAAISWTCATPPVAPTNTAATPNSAGASMASAPTSRRVWDLCQKWKVSNRLLLLKQMNCNVIETATRWKRTMHN